MRQRGTLIVLLLAVLVVSLLVQLAGVEPVTPHRLAATDTAAPVPQRPWATATYRHVYFASPAGVAGNVGTAEQPLALAVALSADGPVGPGDLLWLRGGTYLGNFRSELAGTPDAFIVVAQFPGERAILDGANESGRSVLRVEGSHTVFYGFEVTNSTPRLASADRGTGVDVFGPSIKLINLVVHDTGNGIGVWTPALEAELYGNIVFDAGWDGADRGHGHSIYTQNDAHTKRIVDNILFDGRGFGVHAYTEVGRINNLHFEGNIAFDHGTPSKASGPSANFLVGGRRLAEHPVLRSNYAYYPWSSVGRNADIGYITGCSDALIDGNYLAGGVPIRLTRCTEVTMTGNTFAGRVAEAIAAKYPANRYVVEKPAAGRVFVRPNAYVRGRAHIAIFNWERRWSVRVDLSPLGLRSGESFEIRDVRNYFGTPLLSAIYDGATVELPLHAMTQAQPVDGAPRLAPEFGAAVVLPSRRDISLGVPWITRR